jgi:hypothetical protein
MNLRCTSCNHEYKAPKEAIVAELALTGSYRCPICHAQNVVTITGSIYDDD